MRRVYVRLVHEYVAKSDPGMLVYTCACVPARRALGIGSL